MWHDVRSRTQQQQDTAGKKGCEKNPVLGAQSTSLLTSNIYILYEHSWLDMFIPSPTGSQFLDRFDTDPIIFTIDNRNRKYDDTAVRTRSNPFHTDNGFPLRAPGAIRYRSEAEPLPVGVTLIADRARPLLAMGFGQDWARVHWILFASHQIIRYVPHALSFLPSKELLTKYFFFLILYLPTLSLFNFLISLP